METADLSHHISRRFNEDLERVRNKVLTMGGMVEQQLANAVKALVEGDSNLGVSVGRDDFKVNSMEVSIDEECQKILATRAPAAGDLRVIVATIKTITDLERIGDEGEKIGYIASRLATMERPADKYREVKHLGRIVSEMVHQALDAFARMDADAALRVARQDRVVDEEYESIQRQCITFMMEDPRSIRRALDVMWIVRALERIGDHAKNICEYVIYMVLRQGRPPHPAGGRGARAARPRSVGRKRRATRGPVRSAARSAAAAATTCQKRVGLRSYSGVRVTLSGVARSEPCSSSKANSTASAKRARGSTATARARVWSSHAGRSGRCFASEVWLLNRGCEKAGISPYG